MKITDYGALTTTQPDDVLPIVDVHDFTQAGTGSTKKITVGNLAAGSLDTTATDITAPGDQNAGATTKPADAGHVHPTDSWIPADNGLLFANYDPVASSGGGSSAPVTAGTVYLQKITVHRPITGVTRLRYGIGVVGSGASTGSFIGLYDSGGNLLQTSSDIASTLTSLGPQFGTISSTNLSIGFYWVAIVTNLATTQPTFRTGISGTSVANVTLTAAFLRFAVNGTGQTSLPATITPASNTGTNALTIWIGGSS